MSRARTPFGVTAALLVVAACGSAGKGKTAYVGAQLIDGSGNAAVSDAVIIVSSGHIERIGPSADVTVPRGATVVQLAGKWIIPGLIDGHTHAERWTLGRYLAYGVTSIRDVGGNTDSLVALRSAGLSVHLATNQEHMRAQYLMGPVGLARHVDGLHYSAALGCRKPWPDFFRCVTAQVGLAPEELLLVDDTPENVRGGRAFGWQAVLWTGDKPLSAVLAPHLMS